MSQSKVSPSSTDNVPAAGIIPDAPIMRKQTYASPMSFIGITRRGTAWVRSVGTSTERTALAVAALVVFLAVMYAAIAVWYLIVFGLFGVFTVPYRLVRRSHRKQEHLQRQQLATMQAMLVSQQQVIQQGKPE